MRHSDKQNEWLRPSKTKPPTAHYPVFHFLPHERTKTETTRWGMDLICILYARMLRHHVEFARYELAGMRGLRELFGNIRL